MDGAVFDPAQTQAVGGCGSPLLSCRRMSPVLWALSRFPAKNLSRKGNRCLQWTQSPGSVMDETAWLPKEGFTPPDFFRCSAQSLLCHVCNCILVVLWEHYPLAIASANGRLPPVSDWFLPRCLLPPGSGLRALQLHRSLPAVASWLYNASPWLIMGAGRAEESQAQAKPKACPLPPVLAPLGSGRAARFWILLILAATVQQDRWRFSPWQAAAVRSLSPCVSPLVILSARWSHPCLLLAGSDR